MLMYMLFAFVYCKYTGKLKNKYMGKCKKMKKNSFFTPRKKTGVEMKENVSFYVILYHKYSIWNRNAILLMKNILIIKNKYQSKKTQPIICVQSWVYKLKLIHYLTM